MFYGDFFSVALLAGYGQRGKLGPEDLTTLKEYGLRIKNMLPL